MIAIFDITVIFILATATGVLTSKCEEMRLYLHSYGHLTNISSEVLFYRKTIHEARPSSNVLITVVEIIGVLGWRCVKLQKIGTGAGLAVLG